MSKFRLDYYHLVTQPINKMVGAIAKKSDLFLKKEKVIRYWIKSWFTDVKTKEEFSLSYNQLENYLINNKHILGDFFESAITGLMKSLLSDIESFANHFFLKSVTLGFIGSSIVEGMNQSIKYGAYASKPTMGIDKSSENQVRSAETQALKSYIEVGKSINKVNIWTRSSTSNFLTDYMEGIAVKNFDNRTMYAVSCFALNTWMVTLQAIIDQFEYCDESSTSLKRVESNE